MKINSLHTYSWKPLLKIDAKLFPHRRPDAHVCINLIRCARPAQPVSCCLISLKAPSVQKSWPVLGPDELLQTADSVHHILPPPHPAPALSARRSQFPSARRCRITTLGCRTQSWAIVTRSQQAWGSTTSSQCWTWTALPTSPSSSAASSLQCAQIR